MRRANGVELTRQFQLRGDHVDQTQHGWARGFDHVVRGFAVKRIACFVEIAQFFHRVLHLQQGTVAVVAQAAKHIFRCRHRWRARL